MGWLVDSQLAIVEWKLSLYDQIRYGSLYESVVQGWGCHENNRDVPLKMGNFMFILHFSISRFKPNFAYATIIIQFASGLSFWLFWCCVYRTSIEIHQQVEKVQWLQQLITWWSWVWSSLEPPFNYFNSVQFDRMEDEVAVNSTISSKNCSLASIYGLIQWP